MDQAASSIRFGREVFLSRFCVTSRRSATEFQGHSLKGILPQMTKGTSPSVSAPLVYLRIQAAQPYGVTPAMILRKTGLSEEVFRDPDARIPIEQENAVWQAIVAVTGREDIGLLLGRQFRLPEHAPRSPPPSPTLYRHPPCDDPDRPTSLRCSQPVTTGNPRHRCV